MTSEDLEGLMAVVGNFSDIQKNFSLSKNSYICTKNSPPSPNSGGANHISSSPLIIMPYSFRCTCYSVS